MNLDIEHYLRTKPMMEQQIISVADTGTGIPSEELSQIFDLFYRVDCSRSRISGGSGIGLAIVKYLVEAHSGKVWAESEAGKGSTFYFSLPLNQTADGR